MLFCIIVTEGIWPYPWPERRDPQEGLKGCTSKVREALQETPGQQTEAAAA